MKPSLPCKNEELGTEPDEICLLSTPYLKDHKEYECWWCPYNWRQKDCKIGRDMYIDIYSKENIGNFVNIKNLRDQTNKIIQIKVEEQKIIVEKYIRPKSGRLFDF